MKLISLTDLKGYTTILDLPSYYVMENKQTFHQYILSTKRLKDTFKRVVVGEGRFPGLTSDPEVTIPAGMWRELMKLKFPEPRVIFRQQQPNPAPVWEQLQAQVPRPPRLFVDDPEVNFYAPIDPEID